MNFFDLLIIYLACGAPFGVHHFISCTNRSFTTVLESSLHAFVWILILPGYLHSQVKNVLRTGKVFADRTGQFLPGSQAARVVKMIDQHSRSSNTYPGIYAVREAVERYAGISSLLTEEDSDQQAVASEIFGISGHPAPELGAICLRRRNRQELMRHHSEAAADLINLCGEMAPDSEFPESVISSFEELFADFKDFEAAAELKKRAGIDRTTGSPGTTKDREQALWENSKLIPQKQKHMALGLTDMTMISTLQSED